MNSFEYKTYSYIVESLKEVPNIRDAIFDTKLLKIIILTDKDNSLLVTPLIQLAPEQENLFQYYFERFIKKDLIKITSDYISIFQEEVEHIELIIFEGTFISSVSENKQLSKNLKVENLKVLLRYC